MHLENMYQGSDLKQQLDIICGIINTVMKWCNKNTVFHLRQQYNMVMEGCDDNKDKIYLKNKIKEYKEYADYYKCPICPNKKVWKQKNKKQQIQQFQNHENGAKHQNNLKKKKSF
eukprot:545957_1